MSSTTVYLSDGSSTYVGSYVDGETIIGNDEQIGDGQDANFTLEGNGDTVTGGGYNTITVTSNSSATINGGNNTIDLGDGDNNSVVTDTSSNDDVNIGGSDDTLYAASGNTDYVASNDQGITITGNNQTIGDGAYATFTISGTGDSISGGGWNNIFVDGNSTATINGGNENVTLATYANESKILIESGNDKVTVSGSSDTVLSDAGVSFDITAGTSGNYIDVSNSAIELGNSASVTIVGSNDSISGGSGNTIVTFGDYNTIIDSNSLNTLEALATGNAGMVDGSSDVNTYSTDHSAPSDPFNVVYDPGLTPGAEEDGDNDTDSTLVQSNIASSNDSNKAIGTSIVDDATISGASGGIGSTSMQFLKGDHAAKNPTVTDIIGSGTSHCLSGTSSGFGLPDHTSVGKLNVDFLPASAIQGTLKPLEFGSVSQEHSAYFAGPSVIDGSGSGSNAHLASLIGSITNNHS